MNAPTDKEIIGCAQEILDDRLSNGYFSNIAEGKHVLEQVKTTVPGFGRTKYKVEFTISRTKEGINQTARIIQ